MRWLQVSRAVQMIEGGSLKATQQMRDTLHGRSWVLATVATPKVSEKTVVLFLFSLLSARVPLVARTAPITVPSLGLNGATLGRALDIDLLRCVVAGWAVHLHVVLAVRNLPVLAMALLLQPVLEWVRFKLEIRH